MIASDVECAACNAEPGEACRPGCIGEAAHDEPSCGCTPSGIGGRHGRDCSDMPDMRDR